MYQRLKEAREEAGYTQAEMASLLGYKSKSGYAMIEHGRNTPTLQVALKLAELLGKDVRELFGGNDSLEQAE